MPVVFTLASGRSGTHYLYELIRRNALDCAVRHETYVFNPSMFGRPIYDYAVDDRRRSRQLVERKRQLIERCGSSTYVETSHAFLKSWPDLATEFFPRLKLIHLVRDPLKVAKSEAVREDWIKRLRLPLCHYRGADGRRYFYWSLTGREPIFAQLAGRALTRLQWYLVQWIEIENRAMRFLDTNDKHGECCTLQSPDDLNNAQRVQSLLDFLQLGRRQASVVLAGRKNRNWRPTEITSDDQRQLREVVQALPPTYLQIFCREPYRSWAMLDELRTSLHGTSANGE